jgi:hypothetical protein
MRRPRRNGESRVCLLVLGVAAREAALVVGVKRLVAQTRMSQTGGVLPSYEKADSTSTGRSFYSRQSAATDWPPRTGRIPDPTLPRCPQPSHTSLGADARKRILQRRSRQSLFHERPLVTTFSP